MPLGIEFQGFTPLKRTDLRPFLKLYYQDRLNNSTRTIPREGTDNNSTKDPGGGYLVYLSDTVFQAIVFAYFF